MTRKMRAAILAGIATVAVAGTAVAAERDTHVLTVALPDGAVEHIRYKGDVAPGVVIARAPARVERVHFVPMRVVPVSLAMPDPFETGVAPFALFDRIAAEMDRQAQGMMRLAAAADRAAPGGRLDLAAFGGLPAGTVHYSMVASSNGQAVCSRSVRVTSLGAGKAPRVVSRTSGDCGVPAPAGQVSAPAGAPRVTPVKLDRAPDRPAEPAPDRATI